MPAHFDTDAEDAKLASIHEKEAEDLAQVLAEKHGLRYVDLGIMLINMDALRIIPEADAKEAEAIAFDKNGKHVSLAVHNPGNLALTKVRHDLEAQGIIIEQFLASKKSIEKGLSRYIDLSYAHEDRAGVFDIHSEDLAAFVSNLTTLSNLRDQLTQSTDPAHRAQVSKVLEQVLAAALALRASDIHIEPEEEGVRLRLRIDGVLTDAFTFDAHQYSLLASRIKLLSGLKLNIKDRPQDGRFSIQVKNDIEVRTSIIPGAYGESIVMRIFESGRALGLV